jgi:hypothetical protein
MSFPDGTGRRQACGVRQPEEPPAEGGQLLPSARGGVGGQGGALRHGCERLNQRDRFSVPPHSHDAHVYPSTARIA